MCRLTKEIILLFSSCILNELMCVVVCVRVCICSSFIFIVIFCGTLKFYRVEQEGLFLFVCLSIAKDVVTAIIGFLFICSLAIWMYNVKIESTDNCLFFFVFCSSLTFSTWDATKTLIDNGKLSLMWQYNNVYWLLCTKYI